MPVIGIIKKVYADSSVYITPTMEEIDALAACGADIIATDGTLRMRPQGESLDDFFQPCPEKNIRSSFLWRTVRLTKRECMRRK